MYYLPVRSFVNLHVRTKNADEVASLAEQLRTPGLTLYVVPDEPWFSLYDEGLEADESRRDLLTALEQASLLGRAATFMVMEDEQLFWALADGGKIVYRSAVGPEETWKRGMLPSDLDEVAVAAAEVGEPKTASVRALARMLGLEPDHAVTGFGDLLEMDEENQLPETVWVFEDPEIQLQVFAERPYLEEKDASS